MTPAGSMPQRECASAPRARWKAFAAGLLLSLGVAAGAAAAPHVAFVPVVGTVGGAPEGVVFSGSVQIRSTLVKDPDFGRPPSVQLTIDLVELVGKGLISGAKYVSSAEFVHRTELNSNETIELTFPFHPDSRKGQLAARAGLMLLTLKFDARNGAVTGAACRVAGIE